MWLRREPAPAVRFDFGELRTDAAGHAQRFTPDGEHERAIVAAGTSVFRADTAFRAIVSYVPVEGGIRPMQILPVPVHFSQNIPSFRFKAEPVRLIAAWRGGRYLNLRLGLPGRFGEKHALAFDRRPTVEWPDGHSHRRLAFASRSPVRSPRLPARHLSQSRSFSLPRRTRGTL